MSIKCPVQNLQNYKMSFLRFFSEIKETFVGRWLLQPIRFKICLVEYMDTICDNPVFYCGAICFVVLLLLHHTVHISGPASFFIYK